MAMLHLVKFLWSKKAASEPNDAVLDFESLRSMTGSSDNLQHNYSQSHFISCLVPPLSVGLSFKFWRLVLFNIYYSRKYFMEVFQQVKLITVCKKIAKSGWWRVTRWTHEAEGHESLHASHRQFRHQDKHTNMARTAAPGTPAATTMGAGDTQGEVLGEKKTEKTLWKMLQETHRGKNFRKRRHLRISKRLPAYARENKIDSRREKAKGDAQGPCSPICRLNKLRQKSLCWGTQLLCQTHHLSCKAQNSFDL